MMPLCKAITKQLLGARYEGAARALAAAGVLYLAVRASGWLLRRRQPWAALLAAALAVQCAALLWLTGRQKN